MRKISDVPEVPSNFRQYVLFYPLMSIIIGVLALTSGFGCSHDHKVDLKPEIFVRVSSIGKGERLIIQVRDVRVQKAISKKQSDLKISSDRSINTVNIYASSDVRDTVLEKVMGGFERMGFHASKRGNPSNSMLIVEISKLQLKYQRGSAGSSVPKVHAQMETILRVKANRGERVFKEVYSSRLTKSHRILTGKFKNERLINNSLSMAIQKMFDDPQLLQFLLPSKS